MLETAPHLCLDVISSQRCAMLYGAWSLFCPIVHSDSIEWQYKVAL